MSKLIEKQVKELEELKSSKGKEGMTLHQRQNLHKAEYPI